MYEEDIDCYDEKQRLNDIIDSLNLEIKEILETLPDDSPCKFPETGCSIAEDIRDLVKKAGK